jgi:glycosyltransferase involved in cell wall biosynthesis
MGENIVLIYTYYWPPASAGGVWRFLKFSKYLPAYGWTPVIITVKNGAYSATDQTLLKAIPPQAKVFKTPSLEPYLIYNFLQGKSGKQVPEAMSGSYENQSTFQKISRFIRSNFFIPDPKVGWFPFAVKQGKKVMKEMPVKAIITTGPPNSVHLIGKKLRKKYNIPWIMDFRDPWTSSYLVKELIARSRLAENIDQGMENKALKLADCVTGISPGLLTEFQDRANRLEVIYNGFDEEEFPPYQKKPQSKFSLAYIGSLKPNQNIHALWQALAELIKERDDFRKDFVLQFTGSPNPHIIDTIKNYGLKDHLNLSGFIPHQQAIEQMQQTSLLLFIVPRAKYAKSITSGKIFEYMASRTPIVSLGPTDGDAAWILKKARRDPIIDYDDKEGIKKSIVRKYNEWTENQKILPQHEGDDHLYFSRKKLTGQLAQLLNELTNEHKAD